MIAQLSAVVDGPACLGGALVLLSGQSRLYHFGGMVAAQQSSNQIFSTLDLKKMKSGCAGEQPSSLWVPVPTNGDVPSARHDLGFFVWGDQLWIFGGRDEHDIELDDLYRFDPNASKSWTQVAGCGCVPDRRLRMMGLNGWNKVATYGEPTRSTSDPEPTLTATTQTDPCLQGPTFWHLGAIRARTRYAAQVCSDPRSPQYFLYVAGEHYALS